MGVRYLFGGQTRVPKQGLPVSPVDTSHFAEPPEEGLRVTWQEHSTALIEIDGRRILTDPVWSRRASPSSLPGPAWFHPPPLPLDELPPLDAVILSHDHYDHLAKPTVLSLARTGVRFHVPLGVWARPEGWGIAPSQITELDWWEKSNVAGGGLEMVATPARHFSGRGLFDLNSTLWASWAIVGPEHRVFFSGDIGPFPGFAEIGRAYGPFDVTLIKIGAYDRTWTDIHLAPEQAIDAHVELAGGVLIPIHWGTFNLAIHDWFEPPERLLRAAADRNIRVSVPRPGGTVTPDSGVGRPWWCSPHSRETVGDTLVSAGEPLR